jgi:purine-nucleoside phosphorylase
MASPHTEGHGGLFHSGKLCGKPVIVLEGRTHFYEGEDAAGKIAFPFFLLCALGVRSVFLTCAAGAVSPGLGEGDLLLVRDHVNLMQRNPLRDLGARGFGRFVDMEGAYDGEMCAVLLEAAGSLGHPLKEGVLAAVLGPSYETPAELCALGAMGVDAVTMSTVPEVILARFTGLRVACVSAITNSALEREATAPLTHRWVLEKAAAMSSNLGELLGAAVRGFNFEH